MYSMTAACRMTGLSAGTLRAWERRHAVVAPLRDASGRRVYDAAMVERLSRLQDLTARGHPIRHLAELDDRMLDALAAEGRRTAHGGAGDICTRVLSAMDRYRADEVDRELSLAIATLPPALLVEHVLAPLLHAIGARWAEGRLDIAQERMVSSLLRARLLAILGQPRDRPPRILFTTLPGERHEIGLLIAALLAFSAGAPALYLGTELPAPELARLANQLRVHAVGLSCVDSGLAEAALPQLRELDAHLDDTIAIWLGGAQADFLCRKLGSARTLRVTDPARLQQLARAA
ncbi:MAG TPA: MerR family transcriptional regulator [Luteimonas sp.]|nr:MerR family transcriptional regulator [Luteimonas sp.]